MTAVAVDGELTPSRVREILASTALVVDAPVVAAALEMSTWALYESVKRGACPIEPIRVGRRLKWRTSDLRELLGVSDPSRIGSGVDHDVTGSP